MKKKQFTDLYATEEFIEYYTGASKAELRNRLKSLYKKQVNLTVVRNEIRAIETLLA